MNTYIIFQTRATDSPIDKECYGGDGEDISWPRVVIFPEGTTTNAKTLIQFKAGAFRVSYPISIQIQKMSLDFPKCIMCFILFRLGPLFNQLLFETKTNGIH